MNGRLSIRRRRWYAAGEGSDTPLDRLVDAAEATISVGVRELCCRLGTDGRSFVRTAENLLQAAQIRLSEEMLRQVVEAEGRAVLACQRAEQLEIDWSAAQCQTHTPEGRLVSRVYISADGVMVPLTTQREKDKRRATVMRQRRSRPKARGMRRKRLGGVKKGADQRYKQFYVSSIYDQDQDHRLVSVTRGHHHKLQRQMRRDAARVHLRAAEERLGLVDGAVCLRNDLEQLPLSALGLDFWHLNEHVQQGRRATFGEQSEAGREWVGGVLHRVKHEGYGSFWEQLTQWRSQQRAKGKRQAADELLHYVAQRREMIDYPRFVQRGWHIGSGPIESMCGVTTRRVKGPGMRWDGDNAEAMIGLEALHQSNQWEQYWTNVLRAET